MPAVAFFRFLRHENKGTDRRGETQGKDDGVRGGKSRDGRAAGDPAAQRHPRRERRGPGPAHAGLGRRLARATLAHTCGQTACPARPRRHQGAAGHSRAGARPALHGGGVQDGEDPGHSPGAGLPHDEACSEGIGDRGMLGDIPQCRQVCHFEGAGERGRPQCHDYRLQAYSGVSP